MFAGFSFPNNGVWVLTILLYIPVLEQNLQTNFSLRQKFYSMQRLLHKLRRNLAQNYCIESKLRHQQIFIEHKTPQIKKSPFL
jgi:hypothetical protein